MRNEERMGNLANMASRLDQLLARPSILPVATAAVGVAGDLGGQGEGSGVLGGGGSGGGCDEWECVVGDGDGANGGESGGVGEEGFDGEGLLQGSEGQDDVYPALPPSLMPFLGSGVCEGEDLW